MNEMKKWTDWLKVFEEEGSVVMDDDGGRQLYREGRYDEPITREEANSLLMICTCMFKRV